MGFINNRSGTLFLGVTVSICLVIIVTPGFSKSVHNPNDDQKSISCYKNNGQTPMIGDSPHPLDCQKFYTCTFSANGQVEPVLRECPLGHNSTILFYDFRNCQCEGDISQCFDLESEEDQNDRFICADVADPKLKLPIQI